MDKKRVGDLFVEKKVISPEQKKSILEYGEKSGKSFGEAGLELGVISREDMIKVFGSNYAVDFFYLDARYFPSLTKDALSLEEIEKYGALPLGFKKKSGFLAKDKYLNIGFLDPANAAEIEAVREIILTRMEKERVKEIKIFLILADQFQEVLYTIYGKGRHVSFKA